MITICTGVNKYDPTIEHIVDVALQVYNEKKDLSSDSFLTSIIQQTELQTTTSSLKHFIPSTIETFESLLQNKLSAYTMSYPTFGFHTTAEEVISAFGSVIHNKTILITGPTPGSLGATIIERLAAHPTYKPAHSILLGRSEEKTQPLITKSTFSVIHKHDHSLTYDL